MWICKVIICMCVSGMIYGFNFKKTAEAYREKKITYTKLPHILY